MIKAVFFDWLNTIAHPEPDRHELFSKVAQELGIELPPQKLIKAIHVAESQVPAGAPPRWSEGKDEGPFIRYQEVLSTELGVKMPRETMLEFTRRISRLVRGGSVTWVLYDDVLPTVKTLKKRGLILGLISNLIIGKVELESYLNFIVTAKEIGVDKPQPPIFLAALERAGVNASEAVYIGDQYETDVVGARGVGIKPVLIDRYDLMPEVTDCPRIHSLSEVIQYL
ncbi:MAG: HAD-IA family hydrolase [Dehalococcoidia bacterium]|nr:MAG: HAD-IA family hydrolase [Dehalococcoidia bacterium]